MTTTVIIGAGHGGVQAAVSLREQGYDGRIQLVDSQRELPYQRPPLSKAYMKGETEAHQIVLRADAFYEAQKIELLLGEQVLRIDPSRRRVLLKSGAALTSDTLVLATGARARPWPMAGADAANVFALRDIADAARIRAALLAAESIAVVGAGFIGLEFAAVAARLGKRVTVIETQDRVMARAVSPAVSEAFAAMHHGLGIDLRLRESVTALDQADGRVTSMTLGSGARLPVDMIVVGIGVFAHDRLAMEAGLACANGITVDATMRTSADGIFAIGDAVNHPNRFFGSTVRLESVQNAVDQAKTAARVICGQSQPYAAVPWFWSDQADLKLQITGVAAVIDQHVLRGDPASGAFSVFGFAGGKLRVVESVNRPADHMVARRLIGDAIPLSSHEAADLSFDLRALSQSWKP
jgi:3-phenylpropionate/trans-cinnamate dioxygenase ferredoxin reductase component